MIVMMVMMTDNDTETLSLLPLPLSITPISRSYIKFRRHLSLSGIFGSQWTSFVTLESLIMNWWRENLRKIYVNIFHN